MNRANITYRSTYHCNYMACGRNTKRQGLYFMGWEGENGRTMWGMVCGTHDKELGRKNLARFYDLSNNEAVRYDIMLDSAAKLEDKRRHHDNR